jgi:hypothetical protein
VRSAEVFFLGDAGVTLGDACDEPDLVLARDLADRVAQVLLMVEVDQDARPLSGRSENLCE